MDSSAKLRFGLHWARSHWKYILLGFLLVIFVLVTVGSGSEAVYKVVLDAGSTGTRIHVFKFGVTKSSAGDAPIDDLDLTLTSTPLFTKVSGGLSDFATDVKGCRPGLQSLIREAQNVVPKSKWRETEVILLATAGLRLLKPEQADALLAEAKDVLMKSGFQVGTVDTIDGKLEAKLMYTMTHFVTSADMGDAKRKMAIVDLGGGSVQLAYRAELAGKPVTTDATTKEVEAYLESTHRSSLYLHSWLGYGLVAFRMKALEIAGSGNPHPCVPEWTPTGTQYKYGEKSVPVTRRNSSDGTGVSPVNACLGLIKEALNTDNSHQCKALTQSLTNAVPVGGVCGLDGSWLGPTAPNAIAEWRLFSYIFDLAQEEGLVAPNKSEGRITANDFLHAADRHCRASMSDSNGKNEWWKCIDLVYVSALLSEGFKLEGDFPLKVTKHLTYKGEIELEAAWPLGAAIAAIKNEL